MKHVCNAGPNLQFIANQQTDRRPSENDSIKARMEYSIVIEDSMETVSRVTLSSNWVENSVWRFATSCQIPETLPLCKFGPRLKSSSTYSAGEVHLHGKNTDILGASGGLDIGRSVDGDGHIVELEGGWWRGRGGVKDRWNASEDSALYVI